jgi:hypothetical protein
VWRGRRPGNPKGLRCVGYQGNYPDRSIRLSFPSVARGNSPDSQRVEIVVYGGEKEGPCERMPAIPNAPPGAPASSSNCATRYPCGVNSSSSFCVPPAFTASPLAVSPIKGCVYAGPNTLALSLDDPRESNDPSKTAMGIQNLRCFISKRPLG